MEAPTAPPVTLLGRLRATPATKRRGFGLAEISIPEEPAEGDATPFRVRNTFIDPVVMRTPSLEDFFCERAVQTCPGSQVGRLEGLFQEEGPLPPTPTRLASTPAAAPPSPAGGADPWGRSAGFGASPTADVQAGAERPGRAGPAEPLWPTALLPDAAAGPRAAPELQPEIVWPAAAGLGGAGGSAGLWAPAPPAAPPPQPQDRPWAYDIPWAYDYPGTYVTASGALAAGARQPVAPGLPLPPCAAPPPAAARLPPPCAAAPLVLAAPAPLPPPRAALGGAVPAPPSGPAPGSAELPSMGSALHAAGRCKPCAFLGTKGCNNGAVCSFCHLCEPGEKKRRSKEKQASRRAPAAAGATHAAAAAPVPLAAPR